MDLINAAAVVESNVIECCKRTNELGAKLSSKYYKLLVMNTACLFDSGEWIGIKLSAAWIMVPDESLLENWLAECAQAFECLLVLLLALFMASFPKLVYCWIWLNLTWLLMSRLACHWRWNIPLVHEWLLYWRWNIPRSIKSVKP